jgi:Domain of Unknown Function (DUF1080)
MTCNRNFHRAKNWTFLCLFLWAVLNLIFVGCSSTEPSGPSEYSAATNKWPVTVGTNSPLARPISERPAFKDILQAAADKPSTPLEAADWVPLFDGKSLKGWKPTDFAGHGDVSCERGMIIFETGAPFSGLNWTDNIPRINYEVSLDAMRLNGSDFFCGLTVPVKNSCCSLIVGGWGGSLVGISSLDGLDASENETTKFMNFENGRWYQVRMRVTDDRIEAWIDNEQLVNVVTTDRRISVRPGEIELSQPFGICCWQTPAALRQIKMRHVAEPAGPAKK